ncbi:MAG TPA: Fe-S cluster assembly protein HesB [Actinomycetota bacterium]|nr:Fe-S cluster assembly protein HesB [Actinomycetota bacterium]
MVMPKTATKFRLAARGLAGEPVDLPRTFLSHGMADLPPMWVDEDTPAFGATISLSKGRPRSVRVTDDSKDRAVVEVFGRAPGSAAKAEIKSTVRHILRLDEDLSEFYAQAAEDPDLKWVTSGAGRMIRSATVFEEVVKTVCTTNCSWAMTIKMVSAMVEHLGEPAVGAPAGSHQGRAFPTPEAMASVDESFYREVVRAGYRGPYFRELARRVAESEIDLEAVGNAPADEVSDEELDAALQALPGVGPYASATIMMMLGRYSRLILDSWTRPKYARLVGRKSVKDATIARRFRPYGRWAGLAFWLFLTKDWIESEELPPMA